MDVITEIKLESDESFKLNPLNIESFSVEYCSKEKTISMFVNHRKISTTLDATIEKFTTLLDQVNKTINSWRMQ
jgi:hypothetical protein